VSDYTVVNHAHVTLGAAVTALGVLGLVVGLVRRIILVGLLFLLIAIAGLVTVFVAAQGTHCAPGSDRHVCVSVHR
jgi:hypothetical protein